MNRIHRYSDVTQQFIFTDISILEVANVYFLIYSPIGNIIKKMAIIDDGEYLSKDVEVISGNEVIVRINRSETEHLAYGRYNYQVRVAYNNTSFYDSIEIRSDSYPSFDIISDHESTGEGEGIDLGFIIGGSQTGEVSSVFGRSGDVKAELGDYEADQINDSLSVNKFTNQSDIDRLAGTSGSNSGDETEITTKVKYESNANTNAYTDSEKSKLAGLESSKNLGQYVSLVALESAYPSPPEGSFGYVDGGIGEDVVMYIWDSNDSNYVLQQGTPTVETPSSIKTKYESNADTNAFTDAYKSNVDTNTLKRTYPQLDEDKLSNVEDNATNGADWDLNVTNKPNTITPQQELDIINNKSHSDIVSGNPHNIDADDVGLGNVDNTSDESKPISTATQTELNNKVDKVNGYSLSENNYSNGEKIKLEGIENGATADQSGNEIITAINNELGSNNWQGGFADVIDGGESEEEEYNQILDGGNA